MYHVNIGFRSDRGRKRDRDEDSLAVVHMQAIYESKGAQSVLLVVADGMGGHRAGEVASQLAVQGLITTLTPDLVKEPPQDICALMASAIEGINRTLLDHVQAHPDYHGMGTTITSAVIMGPRLHIGHVGDSRAYILNGNHIRQVTRDHSLVQEMIDSGQLSREEARVHPQKHIITRAVGILPQVKVDSHIENLYEGDILLLCCDGLTDMLTDEEILSIMNDHDDPQAMCDALIEHANEKGGSDNISVIIFRCDDLPNREEVLSEETRLKPQKIPGTHLGVQSGSW